MKTVMKCKECGRDEYYGMMTWLNGKQMCRVCINKVWGTEPKTTFPIYDDE